MSDRRRVQAPFDPSRAKVMVDDARSQGADLVLLPQDLDEPGLADRLKRETVGQAVDEVEQAVEEGEGIAVLLVRPDRSTRLAAGRLSPGRSCAGMVSSSAYSRDMVALSRLGSG